MGFTSQDDLITQITAGKYLRREGSKLMTPAHTAGGWHLLAGMGGFPNASTFPGTDLLWSNCDEFTGDGTTILGLNHGGAPGGAATKHLINVGAMAVAAAGAPWQVKLVDLQGYYRLSTTNVTGTGSRVLINSNTVVASSSSGLLLTFANDFKSGYQGSIHDDDNSPDRFGSCHGLLVGSSLGHDCSSRNLVRQLRRWHRRRLH
jgi:hypothetical protein